ncbi:MAG: DUF1566 domain-containing protein, partial [Bacteroidota bacterium]
MKNIIYILPLLFLMSGCFDEEQSEPASHSFVADKPVTIEYENQIIHMMPVDINYMYTWCKYPYDVNVGANSLTDGTYNTGIIVEEYGEGDYPAYICDTLTAYGYSDWYLPSKNELNAMYEQKDTLGSFENYAYWSSTEAGENEAWVQNFDNGNQSAYLKSTSAYIRCVRC